MANVILVSFSMEDNNLASDLRSIITTLQFTDLGQDNYHGSITLEREIESAMLEKMAAFVESIESAVKSNSSSGELLITWGND